jgi:hypothetical protein
MPRAASAASVAALRARASSGNGSSAPGCGSHGARRHEHLAVGRAHRAVLEEDDGVDGARPRAERVHLRRLHVHRQVVTNALDVAHDAVAHRRHWALAAVHDEADEALQVRRELRVLRVAAVPQAVREGRGRRVAVRRVHVHEHGGKEARTS